MFFAFDEQQLMFRDAARALLADACTPAAVRAAWSAADGLVPGLWTRLAEQGFVGILASEDVGGLGLRLVDAVLVLEELGRASAPGPFLETAIVTLPLLDALRPELAAAVAAGEVVVATSLGHEGALAPHATSADVLLLAHGDQLHLVGRAGAELAAVTSVDRTRHLSRVVWEPATSTLLTDDPTALAAVSDRGALATAAQLVGLSARMLEMTTEYAGVRRQFGRAIGSFQAVQHHLVDALLAVEFARPLVYRAAWELSEGAATASQSASMAKVLASQAALVAAKKALQVHGAIGYTTECDLHLWMKRAWVLAASWGDAAWHRRRVGRALLDPQHKKTSRGLRAGERIHG